jgi:Family of unknown function (DUF6065)
MDDVKPQGPRRRAVDHAAQLAVDGPLDPTRLPPVGEWSDTDGPTLAAYRLGWSPPMRLVPAPRARDWMKARERFPTRCLPLMIANQSGWVLLSNHSLRARWGGGDHPGNLKLEYLSGGPPYPASTHFGFGVITWKLPYLFRTSPGYDLLVRGPTNWPKDGACPLDGVVETDWLPFPFTMNWKLTRKDTWVTFEEGDPIAMIHPVRRGELEAVQPFVTDIDTEPDLARGVERWAQLRTDHMLSNNKEPWQRYYLQGRSPDQDTVSGHRRKLHLKQFAEDPSTSLQQ